MVEHMHTVGDMKCTDLPSALHSSRRRLTRFSSVPTSQRLPGGNVLVTESDNGRAFEITPDGDVVWDFYNPHRAGDDDEFIATLFEVLRLPVEAWRPGG